MLVDLGGQCVASVVADCVCLPFLRGAGPGMLPSASVRPVEAGRPQSSNNLDVCQRGTSYADIFYHFQGEKTSPAFR